MTGIRELQAGSQLGDYRIVSEVGEGSEGVLFLADDIEVGRLVALKAIDGIEFPHIEEAFKANQIEDPGICHVYATGRAEGIAFIAMSVVDGDALPVLMQQHHERRNPEFWRSLLAHAAESLARAHENGLFHGSLRPSSVMMRHSGMPMILDFGLRGDAVDQSQLAALDLRCFVRLMRMCFRCCEKRVIPEWILALLERLDSPAPGAEVKTMRELVGLLAGPPVQEDEQSLDVAQWVRDHKRGLRLSGWIALSAGLIVLLMGLGTGGMFSGMSSTRVPRRPASAQPEAIEVDQALIKAAEQELAEMQQQQQQVPPPQHTLEQLDEEQADVQQQILKLPDNEGLRLRLAKLQLAAVPLLAERGQGSDAEQCLRSAQKIMQDLTCTEGPDGQKVHWQERARHEGQAMFLLGELRKAKGDTRGARKAYREGLSKFQGWQLDPEAQKVHERLEKAVTGSR